MFLARSFHLVRSSLRSRRRFSCRMLMALHVEVNLRSLSYLLSWCSIRMPSFQHHLGEITFLQPMTSTRLVSQASIDVSTEPASGIEPTPSLSSFIDSDLWTGAKPCFTVSFLVSFQKSLSFPPNLRRSFLKQLGKVLSEAEVIGLMAKGESTDGL